VPRDSHSSESEFPELAEKPQNQLSARRNTASLEELAELDRLLSLCEVQSVRSGVPFPLGAGIRANGVNFAVFSRHATGVRLDLFNRPEDAMPTRTILLNPARNKTGDVWHVWLEGIRPGQLYGYRFAGPMLPMRDTVLIRTNLWLTPAPRQLHPFPAEAIARHWVTIRHPPAGPFVLDYR